MSDGSEDRALERIRHIPADRAEAIALARVHRRFAILQLAIIAYLTLWLVVPLTTSRLAAIALSIAGFAWLPMWLGAMYSVEQACKLLQLNRRTRWALWLLVMLGPTSLLSMNWLHRRISVRWRDLGLQPGYFGLSLDDAVSVVSVRCLDGDNDRESLGETDRCPECGAPT
ncbi:MAG: hypothetical protein CMJ31_00075 [Phycisphaerae bacterium]|nr:hypothetical protein [Phycisphaerae bacterium]